MKFFKQQKVTCLSHFPEDMSTMQKLVASMIHHAADIFKVCTCVALRNSQNIQSFWWKIEQFLNSCTLLYLPGLVGEHLTLNL